ncbi:MAG: hypothetical protein C0624_11330 [Desulfuromonas sp.]|nr:MAG: hypothetical protein C0624_11330 [Desulfuromonas sp.]
MVLDISVAITWILFLAMFPMAFIWLRRAYRILVKRNYDEVALKRGESPPNPEKWALFTGTTNLVAGIAVVVAIVGVVAGLMPYKTWSALAGITLWMKVFIDYIISRQAHPWIKRKAKNDDKNELEATK